MIRMGARFHKDDAVSAASRSQLSAINRTVTDLQNMENQAGARRVGNPTGSSAGPSGHPSSDLRKAAPRRTNIVSSDTLYRFEWFRLLSLMIYLLVSIWTMMIVVIGTFKSPLPKPFYALTGSVIGITAACVFSWASTSFLSIFFQPNMWSFFDRRLRLNQEKWQIAFRVLWYLWYFTLLGTGVYWMY